MTSQPAGTLQIVPAGPEDLPAVLALFDRSVEWLVERGITGQWGTMPFSAVPGAPERFRQWIDGGVMFLGYRDGELVATVAVSLDSPPYCADQCRDLPAPARHIEAFTTARHLAGKGIGRHVLQWAESYAQNQHAEYLRLDCWGDNPALCSYYERAGFVPCGDFYVHGWHGKLFQKALGTRSM